MQKGAADRFVFLPDGTMRLGHQLNEDTTWQLVGVKKKTNSLTIRIGESRLRGEHTFVFDGNDRFSWRVSGNLRYLFTRED